MDPKDVRLLSVGTALPGPPIGTDRLAGKFGMDGVWRQWVDAFVGTDNRHLAVDLDSGQVDVQLAELCETAGRRALEASGTQVEEIDLVVLGTATPQHLIPTTVNLIADRLGIDGLSTYQLQSGCAGAVQALGVARQLLTAGEHTTALVFGGDVFARFYDVKADFTALPPEELINFVLFGDGAGAAVLTTEPITSGVTLRTTRTRLVGRGRAAGATMQWFGSVGGDDRSGAVTEDYKAIEQLAPRLAVEMRDELLGELGWRGTDVDYLLPPQLSGRMTEVMVRRLGLPGAQEVSCVREVGNNGNALVFFQLERALDRLEPGQRAIGIAVESSKWIKAGFALESN